jgi:nucleotide-binding universal stress UspA family protein
LLPEERKKMVAQIEQKYATATATARRKLRVFIPYDGSKTAEATLTGLSRAGLPNDVEALVAVTDVWLPLSPREITRTVDARRLKLLTSGLSSHVPALQCYEEQRVLSLEAEHKLRSMFPAGLVKTESFQDTSVVAETILRRAKRWDAELIVLGSQKSPSSQITDYVGPALKVAGDAHCSVRIARLSDRKVDSAIQVMICVDESASSHKIVNAVSERVWPTGTIANIVMMRKPGPRHVASDAKAAEVLDGCAHTLRASGLEVSIGIEDGEPEEVVLLKSHESSVDCVFIDPDYGRTDVFGGSGLSEVAAAVVLGAQCSVEVVRANDSNNQYLGPAA